MCVLSCLIGSDFAAPWTVARQAPLSMGFSSQEDWSGLPRLLQGWNSHGSFVSWQAGSLSPAPPGKTDCYSNKRASRTSEDPVAFATLFSTLPPPFLLGRLLPGPLPRQQSQPFLRGGCLPPLSFTDGSRFSLEPGGTPCKASAVSTVRTEKQSNVTQLHPT